MGNTVGSCGNRHWHKKWVLIKASLHLTPKQKATVIGSLLGDGTMRVGKGSINANFKVEHGLHQKPYVTWKHRILKPLVFTRPKLSYRHRESGERYAKSWWFRTVRHPTLTAIYRRFYVGDGYRCGRKVLPSSIRHELTPLALAVWVMDDGTYSRGSIEISTYAFSIDEVRLLKKCVWERFQIETSLVRDRDRGYRLYCTKEGTRRLIRIIQPYIIPTMMYKIGFPTP